MGELDTLGTTLDKLASIPLPVVSTWIASARYSPLSGTMYVTQWSGAPFQFYVERAEVMKNGFVVTGSWVRSRI